MSFATSVLLAIVGMVLLLLQLSTVITIFSLVILVVGVVQVIVDFGWLSMVKINANLPSWKDAYPIVVKQRTQKLFLVPFFFDVIFVVISIILFITYGSKL